MGERTPTWAPKHHEGSESKGGGPHGGPKRWAGKGPRPARHIPWPELFKHHLSVVEGHQKMIDMVRKHTVPDTGNFRTISDMLDRCNEMLAMTKKASRDFIPPPVLRDSVPIGSSSASMYPGYSPADHVWGEAAEEYGHAVGEAKRLGIQIGPQPGGPEYQVGQSKRAREVSAAQAATEAAEAAKLNATGVNSTAVNGVKSNGTKLDETAINGSDSNPYFVVDTFPVASKKPAASEESEERPELSKRAKKEHKGLLPAKPEVKVVHEDISDAVDARMKTKEEKREEKRKAKEAKRKRESVEEPTAELEVAGSAEKPKKKKNKKYKDVQEEEITAADIVVEEKAKKRRTEDDEDAEGGKKKKRKQKKSND